MLGLGFLILSIVSGLLWYYQKSKYRRLLKYTALISFLAGVGLSGYPSVVGILFAISALICGLWVGVSFAKYYKQEKELKLPVLLIGFLFWISSAAILMQPDFHLFGMMGNLTAIHKLAILPLAFFPCLMFGCAISNHYKKFKIKEHWYKKIIWLFRVLLLCLSVLFFLTESVLVFILISFIMTIYGFFAGNQRLKMEDWSNMKNSLWIITMFLFGLISQLWIFPALAIVLWLNTAKEGFYKTIRHLIKS